MDVINRLICKVIEDDVVLPNYYSMTRDYEYAVEKIAETEARLKIMEDKLMDLTSRDYDEVADRAMTGDFTGLSFGAKAAVRRLGGDRAMIINVITKIDDESIKVLTNNIDTAVTILNELKNEVLNLKRAARAREDYIRVGTAKFSGLLHLFSKQLIRTYSLPEYERLVDQLSHVKVDDNSYREFRENMCRKLSVALTGLSDSYVNRVLSNAKLFH